MEDLLPEIAKNKVCSWTSFSRSIWWVVQPLVVLDSFREITANNNEKEGDY